LSASLNSRTLFDYAGKEIRVAEINQKMSAPNFWDNADAAQTTVKRLQQLSGSLKPLQKVVAGANDLEVLLEFAEEDPASATELEQTLTRLESELEAVELQAMLSEPEDASNAYLTVQAGEGGSDSADWAEMLLRMYIRWAENRGYDIELLDRSEGEEAGIRNATIVIRGENVFGWLKGETGNHRLVRISPFDSAGRRHTSFAAVDVSPELDDDFEVEVNWDKDVRVDTYRASGAGGQHVNKTDSAIRMTHEPSGVVVQCQNERSQHKNRATAKKMMIAQLYKIEMEKRDAETLAKHGQKSKIGFGGETLRHYVLHPDQYVKDSRTGLRGNPMNVLDGGELDDFLEAFLRGAMADDDEAEQS
jgi:peptide chain release factor 2